MQFIVKGRFPSFNEYTLANRANRYAGADMKKKAELRVIEAIKDQLPDMHIKSPVFVEITWVEGNKKRDLDNICFAKKFVLDAMVKSGLIENDNWSHVKGFLDRFALGEPQVIVNIKECL
jgi:Holliday junction resolvase RusA-like endonuclease